MEEEPMDLVEWINARIEEARRTGQMWMVDPLAMARAWRDAESNSQQPDVI